MEEKIIFCGRPAKLNLDIRHSDGVCHKGDRVVYLGLRDNDILQSAELTNGQVIFIKDGWLNFYYENEPEVDAIAKKHKIKKEYAYLAYCIKHKMVDFRYSKHLNLHLAAIVSVLV